MKLIWSQHALRDVQHLRDFIAQDSPIYARQFIERLLNRVDSLFLFPRMGRVVPEAESQDIRELIYQGYRIMYRSGLHQIEIIAVIHGSRDVGSQSKKPWEDLD